jgi:hypothetical protein
MVKEKHPSLDDKFLPRVGFDNHDTNTIHALLRDLIKLNSGMLDLKNNPELAHVHLQHSLIYKDC